MKEAEWLYHLDVRWGSCPAVAARASACPGLMIRSCDSPAVKPEAVRSCASLLIPDSQECTGECCILLEPLFRISPEPPMSGKRRSPWVMPREHPKETLPFPGHCLSPAVLKMPLSSWSWAWVPPWFLSYIQIANKKCDNERLTDAPGISNLQADYFAYDAKRTGLGPCS